MSSPTIHRPIPRRPLTLGLSNPTTPHADSLPPSPSLSPSPSPSSRRYPVHAPFPDSQTCNRPVDSTSRADSFRVLTISTLSGIYSDGMPDAVADEDDHASASPTSNLMDESTYKLVRDRSHISRHRSSIFSSRSAQPLQSASPLLLALRTGLLFVLGMGYGALLSRLLTAEHKWAAALPVEGMLKPGPVTRDQYLAAWGVGGVIMGGLLPWLDGKWEQVTEKKNHEIEKSNLAYAGTDWAVVVRGIGAFVGIMFAIQAKRKVPWASVMQVSLSLAVVSPFLWYMIDRSKPGFLLSSAVGLAGSLVLMGLNAEVMPMPIGFSPALLQHNVTGAKADESWIFGGLAAQKTVETGIWALSVLFCSCVCFGNIGRRLALNRSAVGRGRWGGLR